MSIPCEQCPVLAMCVSRERVVCKSLTEFMRSVPGPMNIDVLKCELVEFSYMTNDVRFIRDKEEANEIRKMSNGARRAIEGQST